MISNHLPSGQNKFLANSDFINLRMFILERKNWKCYVSLFDGTYQYQYIPAGSFLSLASYKTFKSDEVLPNYCELTQFADDDTDIFKSDENPKIILPCRSIITLARKEKVKIKTFIVRSRKPRWSLPCLRTIKISINDRSCCTSEFAIRTDFWLRSHA